jgi:hypothetical protein
MPEHVFNVFTVLNGLQVSGFGQPARNHVDKLQSFIVAPLCVVAPLAAFPPECEQPLFTSADRSKRQAHRGHFGVACH